MQWGEFSVHAWADVNFDALATNHHTIVPDLVSFPDPTICHEGGSRDLDFCGFCSGF